MSEQRSDRLSGVWAAGFTPFNQDLSIDHERLIAHMDWLLKDGCDGVLLFGTTGEAMSCSVAERRDALDAVLDAGYDPGRLLVGTGASALPDAIELTQHATDRGVAGCLVVPSFYLPDPGPAGVLAWYRSLLDGLTDRPRLYLYHIPQVSGVAIHDEVITGLGDVVLGMKDSSGVWENTARLLRTYPELSIFRGSEDRMEEILAEGAVGVISATGNIMAPAMRAVYDGVGDDGLLTKARLAFADFPTVPAAKAVLAQWRDDPTWQVVRPPLLPAPEIPGAITAALESLGLEAR